MLTVEKPYINGTHPTITGNSSVEQLIRELATLRAQNKQLSSRLAKKDRRSITVERSIRDAHSLLTEAFSQGNTSRDQMKEIHGVSRRRWAWACAVLRYAGIIERGKTRRWRNGLDFLIDELDIAVKLLETATRELLSNENAYSALLKYVYL